MIGVDMATYIVLLGPPGAGKGTQAKIVSENKSLPHISSGDLFRDNLKNQTELGKLARSFMDRGELVPDDVTVAMIRERLSRPDCAQGALLDGFPRTPAQAAALDELLGSLGGKVNWVPYINVPEGELVERLTGRWTCRTNPQHIYNMKYNPPAKIGLCDHDGGELYQREDDKEETVKNRIQVYFKQTMPLIEYYRKAGVLIEVDGKQSIEKVGSDLLEMLQ
jgi:adenylate kinase